MSSKGFNPYITEADDLSPLYLLTLLFYIRTIWKKDVSTLFYLTCTKNSKPKKIYYLNFLKIITQILQYCRPLICSSCQTYTLWNPIGSFLLYPLNTKLGLGRLGGRALRLGRLRGQVPQIGNTISLSPETMQDRERDRERERERQRQRKKREKDRWIDRKIDIQIDR